MAHQQINYSDFFSSIKNPLKETAGGDGLSGIIKSATGMQYSGINGYGQNVITGPSQVNIATGTVQLVFKDKISRFILDVEKVRGGVYLYGFNIGLPHRVEGNMMCRREQVCNAESGPMGRASLIWQGISTNTVTFNVFDPDRCADQSSHASLALVRYQYACVQENPLVTHIDDASHKQNHARVGCSVCILADHIVPGDQDELKYHWHVLEQPQGSVLSYPVSSTHHITFTPRVAGNYLLELVIKNASDSFMPLQLHYQVEPAINRPSASVFAWQTALVGRPLKIDSAITCETGNEALTYFWTLDRPEGSSAELDSPRALSPCFTPDIAGTYTGQLIVNDGKANSLPARATWVARPIPLRDPVAHLGQDQYLYTGESVLLDGRKSHELPADKAEYRWVIAQKPPGSQAILEGVSLATPLFTPDVDGSYIIELTVCDEYNRSTPLRTIYIASNPDQHPVAKINPGYTALTDTRIELSSDGSSELDDNIRYCWTLRTPADSQIVLSGDSVTNPSFIPDVEGTYIVTLVVNDGKRESLPAVSAWAVEAAPEATPIKGLELKVNYGNGAPGKAGGTDNLLGDSGSRQDSLVLINRDDKELDISGLVVKVLTAPAKARKTSCYTFEQGVKLKAGEAIPLDVYPSEDARVRSFNSNMLLFDQQRACIVEASLKGKILASYVMSTPIYQVDTGDTLGDIAARLYHNRDRWQEIAAMNGIEDPDRLATGMILKLPQ
ncbi:LysM peptidoglycan-binding domain-containing protein [Thalassomonas haliotis]|uniref:LysM peptidoglycan-binding domain-containing protein n=1 Tax=Thalassomonas haliotis TaxID=485448 RepID=A0ABY7V6Y4_9GAMM|nr:LysM peptidoglycan-binding domain-containing protein [Thalassomonas haliotis]WDE09454.1 LysM peptidoglycan-binding domain-containing protein [Thalassomonas haliotis]